MAAHCFMSGISKSLRVLLSHDFTFGFNCSLEFVSRGIVVLKYAFDSVDTDEKFYRLRNVFLIEVLLLRQHAQYPDQLNCKKI